MRPQHDVIIIGAGPAGSAAAGFLAEAGLDSCLLDKAEFPRDKTCGDGLTPRALGLLQDLGVLDLASHAGKRIAGIEVHAPGGLSISAPIPSRDSLPDYLLVLPRYQLDNLLKERAVASGADFQGSIHVKDIRPHPDHVEVCGEQHGHPVSLTAQLALIATGANSRLLLNLGFLDRMPGTILAARAYFEGVRGLGDSLQAHFEGVPSPGYGWVFPISATAANIGVGFWPHSLMARWQPSSSRSAFDQFVQSRKIAWMLQEAKRTSPVQGFPIRFDFPTARTFSERILLLGESAGLVNPLTGEGIDFALESAAIASKNVLAMFSQRDFSFERLKDYDRELRSRFQKLFVFLNRMRALYVNPLILNRAIKSAAHLPELKALMVDILLGNQDASQGLTWRTVRQAILGV